MLQKFSSPQRPTHQQQSSMRESSGSPTRRAECSSQQRRAELKHIQNLKDSQIKRDTLRVNEELKQMRMQTKIK
jgi:hypothetical protein